MKNLLAGLLVLGVAAAEMVELDLSDHETIRRVNTEEI